MPLKPTVFIGESHNSIVYVARQHAFFKTCVILASCAEQQLETVNRRRPIPPRRLAAREGWHRRPACPGRRLADRNGTRQPVSTPAAVKVRRLPPPVSRICDASNFLGISGPGILDFRPRPPASWTAPAERQRRRRFRPHQTWSNEPAPPRAQNWRGAPLPAVSVQAARACGCHRSTRQRLDCGVFSAALVRAPSRCAASSCSSPGMFGRGGHPT